MAYPHKLPELGYDYSALEPHIDEETMRIHHTKHHQAYVDKLNAALEKHPELHSKSARELLEGLESLPQDIKAAVRNHGGGHFNHSFFWPLLKKGVGAEGELVEEIKARFGSLDAFKEEFSKAALGVFGSGWAWLVLDRSELKILTTPNQDSPVSKGMSPIMCIDVWEHAYYLKYRNRRAEYVNSFFEIINWEQANKNFSEAKKQ